MFFQRKKPRTWSGLKLTPQRKSLARQTLVFVHKGAGNTGRANEFLEESSVFWCPVSWHHEMTDTLPEEGLVHCQSSGFVTALHVEHVLTSPRHGCLLLQGGSDLLGALGMPVAPVGNTIAPYAKHTAGSDSVASHKGTRQCFPTPTGRVGLVLSTERKDLH